MFSHLSRVSGVAMSPARFLRPASRLKGTACWHTLRYQHSNNRSRRPDLERRSAERPGSEVPQTQGQTEQRQALYDHFLRKKIYFKSPGEETGTWIAALDSTSMRSLLPPSLQANLLEIFTDHSAEMELASQCLSAYVSTVHQQKVDKLGARTVYASERPGTRALRWYLDSQAYDRSDVLLHLKFFKLVAHCLVAEGVEHLIWQLLYSDHVPASFSDRPKDQWKKSALDGIVCARMFWSEDHRAFANGVSALSKALAEREGGARRPRFIDVIYVGVRLRSFATKVHPKHLDPASFDKFVSSMRIWNNSPTRQGGFEYASSRLNLVHPTRPNPWPAFRFLENFDKSLARTHQMREHFLKPGGKGMFGIYVLVLRLAQALDREGYRQEACRCIDIGRAHLPKLFKMSFVEDFSKSVDSTIYRRIPTAEEVRRGVPTDKDGYVWMGNEHDQQTREASRDLKP